jgi:hypothetical protein
MNKTITNNFFNDEINLESLSTNLEINATSCVYFSKRPVMRN